MLRKRAPFSRLPRPLGEKSCTARISSCGSVRQKCSQCVVSQCSQKLEGQKCSHEFSTRSKKKVLIPTRTLKGFSSRAALTGEPTQCVFDDNDILFPCHRLTDVTNRGHVDSLLRDAYSAYNILFQWNSLGAITLAKLYLSSLPMPVSFVFQPDILAI